jgi:hypothetical protein
MALPNVTDFKLTDSVLNVMALLSSFMVNSRKMTNIKKTQRLSRSNYFLSRQFKRLIKYSTVNDRKSFDYLSQKIIQKSITFRMYAINAVMPKWFSMNPYKLANFLVNLDKIIRNLDTDIKYKRVWIDKKEGDSGRPLGVPDAEWRVYMRMITNISECYSLGQKHNVSLQHGGKAGKGVMTCLKELSKLIPEYNYIYEFDLKGFFDHISHKSITDLYKGTFLEKWYEKALKSKPYLYKIPGTHCGDPIVTSENELASKVFRDQAVSYPPDYFAFTMLSYPDITNLIMRPREDPDSWCIVLNYPPEKDTFRFDEVGLAEIFKDAQNQGFYIPDRANLYSYEKKPITTEDRIMGRENWKDLNLPDQGIPQGTSFGPFLSATVIGLEVKSIPNILMYLDDGLIFYNNKEDEQSLVNQLNKAVSNIKVEVEPKKSRTLTRDHLLTTGLKFLGTRFKEQISTTTTKVRNFFTISSETRKGTIRHLPELTRENALQIIYRMAEAGLITPSKARLSAWFAYNKLGAIIDSTTLQSAIKYNFFGYLLSWLYNPEHDMIALKQKIREGVAKAEATIRRTENSIGAQLLKQESYSYKGKGGTIEVIRPTLNNLSTLACDLFLETYEHGFVSLREFGLDSKNTPAKYLGTEQRRRIANKGMDNICICIQSFEKGQENWKYSQLQQVATRWKTADVHSETIYH